MRDHTCCFTGHRDIPAGEEAAVRAKVREQALFLLAEGYNTFLVGGAVGFDMLAAEVLLDLREKEGKKLSLVSVLPFWRWRDKWPEWAKEREDEILEKCDEISFSRLKNSRQCYLDRDRKMVDRSSMCIAYCKKYGGGTAYTVRYAFKQGIRVVNIADWDPEQLMKKVAEKAELKMRVQ